MENSNVSPSTYLKEYDFSLKSIFLIQHVNLEQKLRNDGVTVSFTFAASDCDNKGKLILETTAGNETHILNKLLTLVSVIDHCGNLSEWICQYLARYHVTRDLVNQQLQELNIDAGVYYFNQSISVVAANSNDHKKVIAILKETFDSVSTKVILKDLQSLQNIDLFISVVKEDIPQSNGIWLDTVLDSQSSSYIITAIGPRNSVISAIQTINKKQHDYKLINTSITDICILKTEYLRLYRKQDILELEEKYSCRIEIETVEDSDKFTPQVCKAIKIECSSLNKDEIDRQIHEIVDGIMIEKEDSISLYSRIGRLCHFHESKSKLEDWQEEFQSMLTLTNHKGYRY